jgi:hypothetical protein
MHTNAGTCALTGDVDELASIDPVTPSATIAGMMACLMRMIPPWHLRRSAACCMAHEPTGATELYVSYCQYLALMYQDMTLCRFFM